MNHAGLLTPEQLERALARQSTSRALGESLVDAGMISRGDLNTALAHKMGYPMVDLASFPIDPAALVKLPHPAAVSHRAMPLLLSQRRLIVAVDKPSRAIKLGQLHSLAGCVVVPVLASKLQIIAALDRIAPDVWSHHVSLHTGFFATTR